MEKQRDKVAKRMQRKLEKPLGESDDNPLLDTPETADENPEVPASSPSSDVA